MTLNEITQIKNLETTKQCVTQCVNILELRNPPCELPTRKAEYHSLSELEEIHLNLNLKR